MVGGEGQVVRLVVLLRFVFRLNQYWIYLVPGKADLHGIHIDEGVIGTRLENHAVDCGIWRDVYLLGGLHLPVAILWWTLLELAEHEGEADQVSAVENLLDLHHANFSIRKLE